LKVNDTFTLLGCVRLLLGFSPAATEHILHAKDRTPSPLLLLFILTGTRVCSRLCRLVWEA